MATGITNSMSYEDNILNHTHNIEEVTGLTDHLAKIQATESLLKQVERLLTTCDNLLAATKYVTKEEVVLIDRYITDIQDIQTRLNSVLSEDVENSLSSLPNINTRLNTIEANILNLNGIYTEHANLISPLKNIINHYLPTDQNDGGIIKQTTDSLQAAIPTELIINKDVTNEAPTEIFIESSTQNDSNQVSTNNYLDYTLTFNNKKGDQNFSTNLNLTADINTYLDYAFRQFINNYLDSFLDGSNVRLSFIEGRLSNLTQYVAQMANYHNFIIKNIYIYFADNIENEDPSALRYLPIPVDPTPEADLDTQADFVNIIPNFPDSARMDNKVFSPAELVGKNFYIIFETSYPIDLANGKVSIGFPDFQEGSLKYVNPDNFKCARLGIPDMSHATYVIYADVNNETKKLTPFTFGNKDQIFGNSLMTEGTYEFMLKVIDPYNPNVNALKAKQITIGYPIYYGVHQESILFTADFSLATFALLNNEFNSPATTIDWSLYNSDETSKYYYYLVPTVLLENKTLVFNTGYGPGGWEKQTNVIIINNIEYTVFRTTYKLTYCPSTQVTEIAS